VWGIERGYCLMIGGEREPVQRLDPIFRSLAPGAIRKRLANGALRLNAAICTAVLPAPGTSSR
jgi:6-phosphogluconate dehydrogenase (decarboxylating)